MLLLFNKSESLECAKVVVLKLDAILFYSGIHFKPPKLRKKYYEDLNRHIPQKINEFASLALAGRYPQLIFYSTKGINQLNVISEVQIKKGHVQVTSKRLNTPQIWRSFLGFTEQMTWCPPRQFQTTAGHYKEAKTPKVTSTLHLSTKKPYSIFPHSAPRSTRCLIIPNKNIPCKIFFPTISGFAYSPKRLTLRPSLLIVSNSRMSICGPMPTGTILNPFSLTFLISSSTCSFLCLKQTLWSVRNTRTQINVGNNKLAFPGSVQLQTLDAAD